MSAHTEAPKNSSLVNKFLNFVEKTGNALPDPVSLFIILAGLVMGLSLVASMAGMSVVHPVSGKEILAINLFSKDMIIKLLTEMPKTFAHFHPLGTVLVAMLGIGIADKSGLMSAALKSLLLKIPSTLLTSMVVFCGVMSSMAADAGYVVVIPLGALLFHMAGRHPLAGLTAAFAGVSAGFSSNLLLTSLDPLLAGITQEAAQIIDPRYEVNVAGNYYIMIAFVPLFVLFGTLVNNFIIEPRLGKYNDEKLEVKKEDTQVSSLEKKGLFWAGLVLGLSVLALLIFTVPQNALFRAEDGSLVPLFRSIVGLMFLLFFLPGLTYAIVTKQVRNDRDAVEMSTDTMKDMGSYIVLSFAAAHFVALFKWSNLGTIVSVSGAQFLEGIGFTGIPLLIAFIIVAGIINLFVGSASAKWAIMAPIFVPMLMSLGYKPELTQAAYRVGDAFTNIITPLMVYFPLIIVFAQKYNKDAKMGTLITLMLPYSIVFGIASTGLLIAWVALGLPLGL